MSDGIGLALGATALTGVVVDRTAVRRAPVLTLFGHRPPEVGVPAENPRLDEPGLILTDFVDRVGDPVGILAADGSSHRGATLAADALRALLYTVTRGQPPADPVGIAHPAHWQRGSVEALRDALAEVAELRDAPLIPDASAALTALQSDPGLPTRGVVALCDVGGTGTSVTLADAADGYRPIAPTVRHTELSGDSIDQALLTHVIGGLSAAGSVDLTGTSAIGSLTRLRGQCRAAKERLSTAAVTALTAELPGHRGEVRLTRTELDEILHDPLAGLVAVLRDLVQRTGVRPADLAAIATVGGGARIPIVTTTLSENFRVPVVTLPQPELTPAIGAGLSATRGPDDEHTLLAAAAPAAAAVPDMAPSGTFGALAWSAAEEIPDVAPAAYDDDPAPAGGMTGARPQLQFAADDSDGDDRRAAAVPWYRRPAAALGIGALAVLAALAAAVYLVNRDDTDVPASTTSPTPTTTAEAPAAPPPAPAPPPESPAPAPAPAPRTVTQTVAPPPATQAPPPPPSSAAPPPPPPSSEAPPPAPPTTAAPPPPATTPPPPVIPTLPYPTIPGLPFVPAPPGVGT